MIDPEIEQYQKDMCAKYIDRYILTLEEREDFDQVYEEIIEYEYKDDSSIWKKILFPFDLIESLKYLEYVSMFGEPTFNFITHHPPMFGVRFKPKYRYILIPPKFTTMYWSTSDYPCEPPEIKKIQLEPLWAVFREGKKSFLKVNQKITTNKVGNIIIKRTSHERIVDIDKLRQIMNDEFKSLKFNLTEDGFNKLYLGDEVDLENKNYLIKL